MWIVKLGGSLARSSQLRAWLAALAGRRDLVLVPGGGPFADQVRGAQQMLGFDDATAHHLALLAMEQYGRALCALRPGLVPAGSLVEIRALSAAGVTPVWMPVPLVIVDPDLPRTWDLTSDSLAAWLGGRLGAQTLVLIKSAPVSLGLVDLDTIDALARDAIVDPLLPGYARAAALTVYVLADEDANAFDGLMAGKPGRAAVAPGAGCLVMQKPARCRGAP